MESVTIVARKHLDNNDSITNLVQALNIRDDRKCGIGGIKTGRQTTFDDGGTAQVWLLVWLRAVTLREARY